MDRWIWEKKFKDSREKAKTGQIRQFFHKIIYGKIFHILIGGRELEPPAWRTIGRQLPWRSGPRSVHLLKISVWDKLLIEDLQRSQTKSKIKISLKEFLSYILCGEIEIDEFEDANCYPKTWKSMKTSKSLWTSKKPSHPMSPDLRVGYIIRFVFDKNLRDARKKVWKLLKRWWLWRLQWIQ